MIRLRFVVCVVSRVVVGITCVYAEEVVGVDDKEWMGRGGGPWRRWGIGSL